MPKGEKWRLFPKKTNEQLEKQRRNKEAARKMAKALMAAAPAAIAGTATVGAVGYDGIATLAGSNPTVDRMFPGLKEQRTVMESIAEAWQDGQSVEQATETAINSARSIGIDHANSKITPYSLESFWTMQQVDQPAEFTQGTTSTERGVGSLLDDFFDNFVDPMSAESFREKVYEAYHDAYETQLNILFITDIDTVHRQAAQIASEDSRLALPGTRQAPMLSIEDFYTDPRVLRLSDEYRALDNFAEVINAEYEFYTRLYTESLHADLRANSLAASGSISETPLVYAAREFRFSPNVQDLLNSGERVLLQGGLLFEPIMNEAGQLERIQVRVVPISQTIEGGEASVVLTPYQLTNPIDVDYNHGITNGVNGTYSSGENRNYSVIEQTITYQGGYDFSSIPLMVATEGIIGPEGADGYPVWRKVGEGEAHLDGVNEDMLNVVSTALFQTFRELGISSIPVITSGTDEAPERVVDTAHSRGDALDIRVNQFDGEMQVRIAEGIASHLPSGCQVLLETPRGRQLESHTHIHIECVPGAVVAGVTEYGDSVVGADGATAAVYRISLRGNRR